MGPVYLYGFFWDNEYGHVYRLRFVSRLIINGDRLLHNQGLQNASTARALMALLNLYARADL